MMIKNKSLIIMFLILILSFFSLQIQTFATENITESKDEFEEDINELTNIINGKGSIIEKIKEEVGDKEITIQVKKEKAEEFDYKNILTTSFIDIFNYLKVFLYKNRFYIIIIVALITILKIREFIKRKRGEDN